jgi:hypothetical protein
MSEAIFIPLFVWILYFAWRLYQEDKLVDFLFYGLTIGLLIITREQALAFIPISVIHYLFVSLIKKEGARPLRLLLLVALTGTPVLLWQIINVQTGTRVESFLEGGVTSLFSSLPNVVVYFQNWVRQLDYLYFGSFFLLIPLLTYTAGRVKSVNSLLRNPSFHLTSLIFLMALGLIFPSTLLMTKAQLYHPNPAKYLMYGRYIDVLIPLIIFFGIGVVGKRINLGRKKVFFILSTLLIVGANLTFPWHAYYNFYWFANKSAVFWVPNVGDQPLYLLLFIIFQVSISAVALFLQARSRKKAVMIFLFLVLIGNTVNLWKNVDIFLKRQDPSGKPLIALQSFIEESNDRIYISKEDLTSSPLIRNYLFFLSHNFYQDKIKFIESCKEIINKQGCLLTKEVMKREALGEYHFGAENYYLYCYDNFTCQ